MATKLIAVPTGAARETITVSDGALIRGRLVNHGNPVAGAEVGLIAQNRGGFGDKLKVIGNPYEEIRIVNKILSPGAELGVRIASASSNECRNDRHAKGLYRLLQDS